MAVVGGAGVDELVVLAGHPAGLATHEADDGGTVLAGFEVFAAGVGEVVFGGTGVFQVGEVFGEAGWTTAMVGLAGLEEVEAVVAVEALHKGSADDAAGHHDENGKRNEKGGDGPEDNPGGDGPQGVSSSARR